MKKELKNVFGKVFITVTVDDLNKWVHTNWVGYLTRENVKAGALAYIDVVRECGFSCVLNDTSGVIGGWDHSLDWVVNEWSPQAASAGIKHFALITTPESFAETTASSFYSSIKAFEVRVFGKAASAEDWLRQYSLKVI
ncbi:STAS/SEC14 domain-containing protein [Pontibacter silvestris]|uniref:STAS/SEC14 domain-containing protein n=1 Tax=Pontibacter silvestris TaxID=2305183 RepID=A0ABW4WYL6_9BACT|nr:STAS/SEC14 domain-containing protein [Pontibacter silvestris]MCC9138959.1 STAS/SEC14 domain-containing protein [Pontibacter silvestris]